MNKKIFFLSIIAILPLLTVAQSNNNWTTYLAYSEATAVAETNNKVFVLSNGNLFSYGKDDQEIITYSKQNGLNDTEISTIKYSSETHTLLIGYGNGNIDLYDENGFSNIPYLKISTNIQDKTINDIFFRNNRAYIACNFGIIVLNIGKKEIAETYKLNKSVSSVCINGETIYAATESGLMQASVKDNLLDEKNWTSVNITNSEIDATKIKKIRWFKTALCMLVSGKGIYCRSANGESKMLYNQSGAKNLEVESGKLITYTSDNLVIFSALENNFEYVNVGIVNDVSSLKEDNIYWIASGSNGLIAMQQDNGNNFTKKVSDINISNSPKRNYNYFMTVHNNKKLLITGGGRTFNRFNLPGTFMVLEDDKWFNLDETELNKKLQDAIGTTSRDYVGVAVDPDDDNHYFIATYGEGIIELKNNEFVEAYNFKNSSLNPAYVINEDDQKRNYVRVGSVCFDKDKNLWATNGMVKNAICVRKADGTWTSLYYQPIAYDKSDIIDKILITRNGHKWVNILMTGIFVFDDKGTIDDTSDDTYHLFESFRDGQSSGTLSGEWHTMAEDNNGTIWLGANSGLFRCGNPEKAVTDPENLTCSQLIRDDGNDRFYFLKGESVNAIAIDADNQKWIGTATSGVFVISSDGSETVDNFTTENSPLLSNNIQSIAINNGTGEVFIGTDKGLVSYKSGITKGGSGNNSNIYAYPNPVRPEYEGNVTIAGLMSNANVKITDINGNLIYQGKASGGQFKWNCLNAHGNRVATGVYLVLASSADGSEGVVTKIAVVK